MNQLIDLFHLMRPHQWVKNGFIFIGLLFGHAWDNFFLTLQVIAAAIAFSFISSGVYIVNDIVDLENDRQHPTKKNRPLANGKVSVSAAIFLAIVSLIVGISLGIWVSLWVSLFLFIYILINLGYSFYLKNIVILDIFLIAAGFMLRILTGTVGVGIPPSQWLLLCGFMVALFMGLIKRRSEIIFLSEEKSLHRKVLGDYSPVLLDKMISISAAGVIMSYSLYTMSSETIRIHRTDKLIYTVPIILYGIFRYIYLLHHQGKGGDPSLELVLDPHVIITICVWFFTVLWLIV